LWALFLARKNGQFWGRSYFSPTLLATWNVHRRGERRAVGCFAGEEAVTVEASLINLQLTALTSCNQSLSLKVFIYELLANEI
jgi:hypothetical protein